MNYDMAKAVEALSPIQESIRQRLLRRITDLRETLEEATRALALLDAHPDLEEFQDTFRRLGF